MPRPRSPNREKAYEIYKEHKGNIENRRIAEILQISEKTVGGWKCKDDWERKLNGVLQTKKRSTPKTKGGQPGNKNAVGNKGGAAPPGNKNAVTTGEFETLLFDCLNEEEKRLAASVPADKQQLLLQEIQLLTVREHRMLKRINAIQDSEEYFEDGQILDGMTMVSRKAGTEKDHETDLKEYRGKLGQVQSIEDALTRVQARKQRAIETLHRFGFDDARLEIEIMKIELATLKLDSQDNEIMDDGFLDALNAEAGGLWGDADGME